jgi:multidrug efflux system outer membrane protein
VAPAAVQIAAGALLALPPPPSAAAPVAAAHPLAATQMASVESSRAVRSVLGRSYFPRISVQTALAARGSGALGNGATAGGARGLFDFDASNWAAGVTATFPLFDWFPVQERRRIELQNERAELATYDRMVQELSSQWEQARARMDGARRVAENTPIRLAAARVLEQQARARYDAGLAGIIEVADAQRLLLEADVGDAVARLGVWQALTADAAARGTLADLVR